MSENNENNNGFWAGIILGGLVGAGIAYFFSSKDQEKNRRAIQVKGKQLLNGINNFGEDALERGEEIKEAVVDTAEDWQKQAVKTVAKAEKKIDEFKEEAAGVIEKVQETAQDAISDVNKSAVKLEKSAEKSIESTQKNFKRFFSRGGRSLVKR